MKRRIKKLENLLKGPSLHRFLGVFFSQLANANSKGIFGQTNTVVSNFDRAGEQLFSSRAAPTNEDDYNPEKESNTSFNPFVYLEPIATKTGEENEESLFCHRPKLYHFDPSTKQWKERGVGDIYIKIKIKLIYTHTYIRCATYIKRNGPCTVRSAPVCGPFNIRSKLVSEPFYLNGQV